MSRSANPLARFLTVALVASLALAAGCAKKPRPTTDVVKQPPVTQQQAPAEPSKPAEPAVTEVVLTDVFFDYDRYNLREDARLALQGNAQLLMQKADLRLLLEGHCDERGTVEYNLALGDRRAQSVKNFLIEFGVDASRLRTISYGEERPFDHGHDEAAWSQNRRVHFVIQQ